MSRIGLVLSTIVPGLLGNCLEHALNKVKSDVWTGVFLNGPQVRTQATYEAIDRWSGAWAFGTESSELIGYTQSIDHVWRLAPADVDVFLFIHDDVLLHEPGWDLKLLEQFTFRPQMMVCGFAGARGFGHPGMYNMPYDLQNLGRVDFYSSLRNWASHGKQLKEPRRGGMLDGLSFCIRRSFLEKIDGWKWWPLPHHGYDYAMSAMAARHGAELWLVPVECDHLSGQTACSDPYQSWARETRGGDTEIFKEAHRLVYEMFRDVLPIRVP